MDYPDDGALHEEFEEPVIRMGQQSPIRPSEEEVRQHNISHVPYRSWCPHCVRGKGRSLVHKNAVSSADDAGRVRPRVSMDYFYLGKKDDVERSLPLLAILDETTQRVFSISMPSKGVEHQYCVAVVVKILKCLGHQHSVLKTDTEPSLVALRNAVQLQISGLGFENATKGESESNGPIESAVGRLQAQARTLKCALEFNYELSLPPRHPVLCWLVDYCGTLLSRFQRGPDGRTAYERSTGKTWKIKLPEFGENVWYQPLKGERAHGKLEPKFELGVFLGIQEGTAMRWVGTPTGVVRTWTIKTLPDDAKWQMDVLNGFIGLPWQLRPAPVPDGGVPRIVLDKAVQIDLPVESPDQQSEAIVVKGKKGYVPRGIYIRKDVELQRYGYTEGCDGCMAARQGLTHRQHNRACRERIAQELLKTEEGRARLERVREKEEKFIVDFQEKEAERGKRAGENVASGAKAKQPRGAVDDSVLDEILGEGALLGSEEGDGDGQGGHSVAAAPMLDGAASGSNDVLVQSGSVDDGMGEEVATQVDEQFSGHMDIGGLHLAAIGQSDEFVQAVREASLCETACLLMDEEVEARRVLLQIGAVSRKDAYDFSSKSIVELFSPPRVTEYARRHRLGDGVAMDLVTCDEHGRPWDFSLEECRARASELIEFLDPDLVIGSPPCGPYSMLQELNVWRTPPDVRARTLAQADEHLEFCCKQYEARHRRHKYFLHEHPAYARSWGRAAIQRLEQMPGVLRVTGDMCEQGMTLSDEHGVGRAKKTTGFLTNSPYIAEELSKRCSNEKDALQVWRQTVRGAVRGQKPGRGGPSWDRVVRRVTLDVSRGVVLQDLHDVQNADTSLVNFPIPKGSRVIESLFYHVVPGKSWHRHIPLIGGKAKQCEVYPNGLIRSILKGLRKQLAKDIPISALDFGPVNQEQDLDLSLGEDDWCTFTDEVSGKALESSKVAAARAEEIDYATRYKVWDVVPISECYQKTGKGPISSRWIDINKGDEQRPAYRSRLVIQEIRQSHIEAIFAATPPLESVRMLLSLQRTGNRRDHRGRRKKVMFIDIRRAHWCAKIFRLVYVRLPDEAGLPEGTCGRLNKAMYGCRDAAACWELEITDFFTCNGFAPGLGSPVLFVNTTRDVKVSIHGDDITALGFEDDLLWLKERLLERYELKFGGLLGPDPSDTQDVALLNRLIHYGEQETTVEADPRHVTILLNELNLHSAKAVGTPGVSKVDGDATALDDSAKRQYRSMVMRCNYLGLDRPDICYASKELARAMQQPTVGNWTGLKRMARFLLGKPRLVWHYRDQPEQTHLRIFTDSDDAGCTASRKSTSCGALFHGSHLLKFYSSTQHVIALSSGESEFYGGIKAGSTLLGGLATMKDLGCDFQGALVFDATAAKAMLGRRGHGKAKHIDRCYLWLQQRVQDGDIELEKIGTKINCADLGTKHLEADRIVQLVKSMGLDYDDGQHNLALKA